MTMVRVIGNHRVYGVEPGAVADLELSEFDLRRLVDGGHLEVVEDTTVAGADDQQEND